MKTKFFYLVAMSFMLSMFTIGCQETKQAANDAAGSMENVAEEAMDATEDMMDDAADAAGDAMENTAEMVDSTMEAASNAVKEKVGGDEN